MTLPSVMPGWKQCCPLLKLPSGGVAPRRTHFAGLAGDASKYKGQPPWGAALYDYSTVVCGLVELLFGLGEVKLVHAKVGCDHAAYRKGGDVQVCPVEGDGERAVIVEGDVFAQRADV